MHLISHQNRFPPCTGRAVHTWSRFIGQFGGLAKLGFGCRHAASFIVPVALYASSGVRPASVECGRRAL
jgi:hypothetical protein